MDKEYKLMFMGELRGRSEPSFGEGSDTSKNFETEAHGKSFLTLLAREKSQTPKAQKTPRMLAFASTSPLLATDKPEGLSVKK